MPKVVSVNFRAAGKRYLYDPGHLDLAPDDLVVAPTIHGLELGLVLTEPREISDREAPADLKHILRKATQDDLSRAEQNVVREEDALIVAAEKVSVHGLPMKLIKAEMTLDGSKIVFHFSAEGRVDFRALVRDLARTLHCRVELHQVGVRDEAKLTGGLGPCGRLLCCASFLTEFDPVSIRMAKAQDLSLNPQKISGACGRLMCCLAFEYQHYQEKRRGLPKIGARITTEHGEGKLTEINVMQDSAVISLEEGRRLVLSLRQLAQYHQTGEQPAEPEEEQADLEPEFEEAN